MPLYDDSEMTAYPVTQKHQIDHDKVAISRTSEKYIQLIARILIISALLTEHQKADIIY